MKRPALTGIAVVVTVLLMLAVQTFLFTSSWQGFRLWWTPIDGEIVSLALTKRTHDCDVAIRTSENVRQLFYLDGDICGERLGSHIRKTSWSLDVKSTSGTVYRQSEPVFSGLAGAVWTALLSSLLLYSVAVAPFVDFLRRRRANRSEDQTTRS